MILFIYMAVSVLGCTRASNDVMTHTDIKTLLVESSVFSRFANVYITSRVENDASESKTSMFSVQVPTEAFITGFSMQNEGKVLRGVVKEKKEADEAYDAARKDGQTAGKVSEAAPPPGRAMKNFVVYMNVAAMSEATFKLSYQELVKKVLGKYTQKIHIEPNQVVNNITVVASYHEPQGIETFSYALPDSEVFSSNSIASQNTAVHESETKRVFVYAPSVGTQLGRGRFGLKGDITLTYTLTPPVTNGGTIIVDDGAFVHYFSPSGLSTLSKTIVFVIDVSGSMRGMKIQQVKVAMHSILARLRENDAFDIILFSDSVDHWQPYPVLATRERISAAKSFVNEMVASGLTNINDALLSGVNDLNNAVRNRGNLVVFLTDGVQTAGEMREDVILENVQRANDDGLVSIFSLGFGAGVNFEFLRKISLQNYGTAYKIYEEEDASEQLGDFFRGIESVTLRDVKFKYPVDIVVKDDLTETSFSNFFNGSEIVVAGNLQPEVDIVNTPLTASIVAVGANRDVIFHSTAEPQSTGETQQFTQRLWAYKKIKEYLDLALISNEEDRKRYEQKALTLSLRYSFVTRLTSMVVTEAVNAGNDRKWLTESKSNQHNFRRKLNKHATRRAYSSHAADIVVADSADIVVADNRNKGTCAVLSIACAMISFVSHFI